MSEPGNIELSRLLMHLAAQLSDDRIIEKDGEAAELLFTCATALGKSAQIVSSPTADAPYATILFQTDLKAFNQNPFHIDTPFGRPVVIHRGNAFAETDANAPVAANGKYLIWSNKHRCWWRADCKGYTTNIHDAGRYVRADALQICNGRDGWTAHEVPASAPVLEADALEIWNCDPELKLETGDAAQ